MAPNCKIPEEIDCFTVPHSRMKELVHTYTQKVHCVDFRDCQQVWKLLDELNHTFFEFKSHESIENMFIMDQLKNRLKQRHIYNSAVCNCHNDNRITEMMKLVRSGKYLANNCVGKRVKFGHKLQKKFSNFVKEFLPHMEEEENIFQPLLIEHFEYAELKIIKEVVLEQHEHIKDQQFYEKATKEACETNEAIKDFRDVDENMWCLADLFSVCEDQLTQSEEEARSTTNNLPNWLSLPVEVMLKIFHSLEPPDRGRCARVCSLWNKYAYSSSLWREIYPIQWSRGIWNWKDAHLNWDMEDRATMVDPRKWDEDADIDETEDAPTPESIFEIKIFNSVISHLLPRVGKGVKSLIMDGGCNVPSRMIREALVQCPHLVKFSAAYCNVDYYSFKGLWQRNCMATLKYLDLQGCVDVDDKVLYSLLDCMNMRKFQSMKQSAQILCFNNSNTVLPVCPFGSESDSNCLCRRQQAKMTEQFCPLSKQRGRIVYNNDGTNIVSNGRVNRSDSSTSSVTNYSTLVHLNLSGCYRLKGIALIGMADDGFLGRLNSLNLSGCFQMPANYLRLVIEFCPGLNPGEFAYCDDIRDGPFDTQANGCDSVDHPLKFCCKSARLH